MEKIFKIDQIKEIAQEILTFIDKKQNENATVLAFYGDLGAGKTTLTKEIASQLGIKENVISPTFVIMKKYQTSHKKFGTLIHIDAYRLNKAEELLNLGWQELVNNKENLIIIEWPERVPECLPSDTYKIEISHENNTTRSIKFCYNI